MYNTYKFIFMDKKPFFSVVIPTYNRASDLQFALYCILQQSFSDFEIIISDNCSSDNTRVIVGELKDKRIRYFRNKENIGAILNYKKAIKHAKGEYIFLHGDDDFVLYENSLQEIYLRIQEHGVGYARVNYVCTTSKKSHVFDFKINKLFYADEYLSPFLGNGKILSFIFNSDPYFSTGIIFKNTIPSNIKIINSEHAPWIEMLLFATKKFGACFIAKQHVVGFWSDSSSKKNIYASQYTSVNGKLEAENYLNQIEKNLRKEEYKVFLRNQLVGIYVRLFPLIKFYVGNKNLLLVSKRIRELDPSITKQIDYWAYLISSFLLPEYLLRIIKKIYFLLYMRLSKVDNREQVIKRIKKLEGDFTSFAQQ